MEWIRSCNLYNAKDPCNVSTKFSNLSSALLDKHISVYISHLFGIRFTLEREKKVHILFGTTVLIYPEYQ
jgi:hypothetical protein